MNKEWSESNKLMQSQIKKRDTYDAGIETLFTLRDDLWKTIPLRIQCGIFSVSKILSLIH